MNIYNPLKVEAHFCLSEWQKIIVNVLYFPTPSTKDVFTEGDGKLFSSAVSWYRLSPVMCGPLLQCCSKLETFFLSYGNKNKILLE